MIFLPALAAVLLSGCRGVGGGLAAAASFAPLWTTLTPTIAPTAVPPPTATPSPTPTATPSATPSPTPSPTPTATPSPTPTATPSPTPSPTPDPATFINGVGFAEIAVMPPEVQAHVREIYARGQELGRNPNAFSKLGDSLSLTSHYLAHFDQKRYNLGIYQSLQGTIDHYRKSFDHFGVALRIGLHAWVAYKPGLADEELCEPDEHMVECEFRLHNPSVLLVRLGTNDVADGDAFERAMRHTVEYSIENGVIPILGTKADRFEGDNANNEIIRRVAAEMRVPLWDFDRVAGTMPNRGLSGDNVHLTMLDFNDYTDPKTMEYGYPVSDLTALVVLQAVRQAIAGEPAGVVDYPTASGRIFGGE